MTRPQTQVHTVMLLIFGMYKEEGRKEASKEGRIHRSAALRMNDASKNSVGMVIRCVWRDWEGIVPYSIQTDRQLFCRCISRQKRYLGGLSWVVVFSLVLLLYNS
jgi:hypothetical protein